MGRYESPEGRGRDRRKGGGGRVYWVSDRGTWLQHCRLATGLLLHVHIAIVPEHPIAPAGIMVPLHLPTPHPTQALMQPNDCILPSRHERFYSQDPMLKDPVILQVCRQSKLVFIYNNKARQVERTLYRLSIYALAQGSDFFASTFSIDNGASPEGKSDEHPVVLPPTITRAEFDVYLLFGVQ